MEGLVVYMYILTFTVAYFHREVVVFLTPDFVELSPERALFFLCGGDRFGYMAHRSYIMDEKRRDVREALDQPYPDRYAAP